MLRQRAAQLQVAGTEMPRSRRLPQQTNSKEHLMLRVSQSRSSNKSRKTRPQPTINSKKLTPPAASQLLRRPLCSRRKKPSNPRTTIRQKMARRTKQRRLTQRVELTLTTCRNRGQTRRLATTIARTGTGTSSPSLRNSSISSKSNHSWFNTRISWRRSASSTRTRTIQRSKGA